MWNIPKRQFKRNEQRHTRKRRKDKQQSSYTPSIQNTEIEIVDQNVMTYKSSLSFQYFMDHWAINYVMHRQIQ